MANKKNLAMYGESLRQLKVVGILISVIGLLAGIFIPLADHIQTQYAIKHGHLGLDYVGGTNASIAVIILGYLLLVLIPILLFMVFSYLNRRNACDFYHAIPVKRINLLLSGLAAVFTWIVIWSVVFIGTYIVTTIILPSIRVDWREFGPMLLHLLVEIVMLMGIFMLGIAISGTVFTGVITSLIIIIAPRTIILIISSVINQNTPLAMSSGIMFLDYSVNILWDMVMSVFDGLNTTVSYYTCLYSAIIGLVYMGIGGLSFVRRKSETASQPSMNKVFQSIFRMIPPYIITLLATMLLLSYLTFNSYEYYSTELIFYIIIIYVMAVVVFVIYELVTSRKWKSVVKSFKQLPILFGMSIMTTLILYGTVTKINSFEADATKIESVTFNGTDIYGFGAVGKYFDGKTTENEELIQLVADAYNSTRDYMMNETDYSMDYRMSVTIRQNGHNYKRVIGISYKEYKELVGELAKETQLDVDKVFPKYTESGVYIEYIYDDTMIKEIYETYREEIAGLGIEYLIDSTGGDGNLTVGYIQVNYTDKWGDYTYTTYPISTHTPKTLALYVKYMVRNDDYDEFKESVYHSVEYDGGSKEELYSQYTSLELTLLGNVSYGDDDKTPYSSTKYWGASILEEQYYEYTIDCIQDVIELLDGSSVEYAETGYIVEADYHYEYSGYVNSEYCNGKRVFFIDEETYKALIEIGNRGYVESPTETETIINKSDE